MVRARRSPRSQETSKPRNLETSKLRKLCTAGILKPSQAHDGYSESDMNSPLALNSQSQENVPDKNTSCGPRRRSRPRSGTVPGAGFHKLRPGTSPAHVQIGPKHSVPGQRLFRSLQQLSITSLGGCLRQMVRMTRLASPTQNSRHTHSTTPSHCGNYPLSVRRVSDNSFSPWLRRTYPLRHVW